MFKVGDKVRVVCDKHGPTWGNKELYIHSPRIGEGGWWVSKRPGAPACTWFFASSLRLPYPDTPAARKQEQLDLIAEKERIIDECNEAIETARKLISEIDDRPPSVGDKYQTCPERDGAYLAATWTLIAQHNGEWIAGRDGLNVVRTLSCLIDHMGAKRINNG